MPTEKKEKVTTKIDKIDSKQPIKKIDKNKVTVTPATGKIPSPKKSTSLMV